MEVKRELFRLLENTTTQRQLELSRLKYRLKIERDYRTKKVGTSRLTMDEIRWIHDTKCVLECVQIGQQSSNSYQGKNLSSFYDWFCDKVEEFNGGVSV